MRWLIVTILLLVYSSIHAQSLIIFEGNPVIKVNEGGSFRVPEGLEPSKAAQLGCIISRNGEEYFWTSRENTPLVRIDTGAFLTFIAINGSGYVRVIKHDLKEAASLMSETERKFDYVEHLVIGLRSVTYFGNYK